MSMPQDPVLEHIRHMFAYYGHGAGALVWRFGRFRGQVAGTPTGASGEMRVRLDGVSYACAKIVWFLEAGYWPLHRLRYLNQDRGDIRFENLEETDRVDGPGR